MRLLIIDKMQTKKEILEELNIVFRSVFHNQLITLTPETCQADIDGWDSLHNALVISAIEKHFKIRFGFSEILKFKTVENISDAVIEKLVSRS